MQQSLSEPCQIQTTVLTVQFQLQVGLQLDEPLERFLVHVLHGLSEFDPDSFDMIRRDLGRRCPVDFHPGKPSCVIDCFVREPFVSQPFITTPLIGVDGCPLATIPLMMSNNTSFVLLLTTKKSVFLDSPFLECLKSISISLFRRFRLMYSSRSTPSPTCLTGKTSISSSESLWVPSSKHYVFRWNASLLMLFTFSNEPVEAPGQQRAPLVPHFHTCN